MAVVVQCFHCNAVLELDDGFRGGVCRCSGCGSLLQVPKGEHEGQAVKKRKRPAGPPGQNVSDAAGGSAASGESGKVDQAGVADAGPSSSTLRRIQQAQPMEQAVQSQQPVTGGATTNGASVLPKEVIAAAAMVPVMPPRRNGLKLGLTIVLFAVLVVVAVLTFYFISRYGGQ